MKDYRVVAKVRNNRILRRIEDRGFVSIAEFCAAFPMLTATKIYAFCAMRESPLLKSGEWTKQAQNLASALGCDPEDLFNEQQKRGGLKTTFVREADDTLALDMVPVETRALPSPDEAIDDIKFDLPKLMEALSERQKRVLTLMYGLDGQPATTLEEAAQQLGGIPRERVRQIQAKAIRRMKERAVSLHLAPSSLKTMWTV